MDVQSVNSIVANNVVSRLTTPESGGATPPAAVQSVKKTTEPEQTPTKETQPSGKQLDEAVKVVNDFVGLVNNSLHFSVDDDTGKTVVKVIDIGTKELIRQIPSEEMLAIAKALDGIKGLLLHQKA